MRCGLWFQFASGAKFSPILMLIGQTGTGKVSIRIGREVLTNALMVEVKASIAKFQFASGAKFSPIAVLINHYIDKT